MKKEEDKKKPQGKNITACPISYGGHKNATTNLIKGLVGSI